jgi:hypothetical protein
MAAREDEAERAAIRGAKVVGVARAVRVVRVAAVPVVFIFCLPS